MGFNFRRHVRGWEVGELERLLTLLQGVSTLFEEVDDKLVWKAEVMGSFSTKSVYDWWLQRFGSYLAFMKFIWRSLAPPRALFFVWLVANGRIKSGELLLRFRIIQEEAETTCGFSLLFDENS